MDKIPRIDIGDARIDRIMPPIIDLVPPPVVDRPQFQRLAVPKPVVSVPNPSVDYPTIFIPPQIAVPTGSSKTSLEGDAKKERSLPTAKIPAPAVNATVPVPPPPQPPAPPQVTRETPVARNTINVVGHDIAIPAPQEIVQASATAIMGTSVTLATAMVFNQARKVVGDALTKAARNKFKVKLRVVKPVIHMIYEDGGITVMEYSSEGIRTLATQVENPEQYLRDVIETDELYEADHKIVIDEPIRDRFSREGASRFNYFAPPKKLARRLAARFALG